MPLIVIIALVVLALSIIFLSIMLCTPRNKHETYTGRFNKMFINNSNKNYNTLPDYIYDLKYFYLENNIYHDKD